MGIVAFVVLVVIALAVGFGIPMLRGRPLSYLWLMTALVGAWGAWFASENVPGASVPLLESIGDWGPTFDGLVLIPAVVVALILGAGTYYGMRGISAEGGLAR